MLGPILFIIYSNDLNASINSHNTYLYADGISFIVKAKSEDDLSSQYHKLLQEKHWFSTNKLKLNKTETTALTVADYSSPNFWDCMWIQNLNVVYILTEIKKRLYSTCAMQKLACREVAKMVSFGKFYGLECHGIADCWASCHAKDIFLLGKKVMRILYNLGHNESCRGVFKDEKTQVSSGQIVTVEFQAKSRLF